RAQILAESLQESVEPALSRGASRDLQRIVERFGARERLEGIAVYDGKGTPIAMTPGLAARFPGTSFLPTLSIDNLAASANPGEFRRVKQQNLFIFALPLTVREIPAGTLAVVHDASYINVQSRSYWQRAFFRASVEVFVIALTALLIIRWSISGPIARTAQWMRALRTGKASVRQ